ncbi:putative RNA uridine N3 methyltransferase [Ferroglobus sp.]|uniref:putative RNA uridine N3 methyltransferase n=1 Tax=Ferroglobus sp. TaxID=2614230 RepID=UPI0025C265C3|nr:putative RNA uridine N3 methyltransferase [Ferroglobus sp.]
MEIAIPSSILENESDEKIKTFKVGIIGRAAAIFRVEKIYIYKDPSRDDSDFISEILRYMETPQYLRKHLFPRSEKLRYAGVLQPLQIPSHKPKHLKVGEIREGVIVKVADGTAWADIGMKALALFRGKARKGARVTVRVCSTNPLVVEEAKPEEYWGFKVEKCSLKKLLKREDAVVTSKLGYYPSVDEMKKVNLLIFGSPSKEVKEIADMLGLEFEAKMWNMIPKQGVRSVRVEEAVISCLSVINFIREVY